MTNTVIRVLSMWSLSQNILLYNFNAFSTLTKHLCTSNTSNCKKGHKFCSLRYDSATSMNCSLFTISQKIPSYHRAQWLQHTFVFFLIRLRIFTFSLKVSKCWSLSRARLFATPWTAAHQAPLSMRFSRQGCWSGLAISISSWSSQPRDRTRVSCTAGRFFTHWATREASFHLNEAR